MANNQSETPMATGTLPSELLTKKEVAQRLRISMRKIELDSSFPSIRFGRTVRYSWPDVVEYLKGQAEAIG